MPEHCKNGSEEMYYSMLSEKLRTKRIRTDRLLIRSYEDRDEDGLLELFHDENTMRMDGDKPILEKNEEFIRRIDLVKNGPLIWFFSVNKMSSEFVGYVMLQDEKDAIALGFAITASKQHKGYGYEMIDAIINLLFICGIPEIRIKTWERNIPCRRLAEKLGFKQVSIIENDHKDPITGETGNSIRYSLKC